MIGLSRAIAVSHAWIDHLTRTQKRGILLGLDLAAALVALIAVARLHAVSPSVVACLALGVLVLALSASLGLHRIKLNTYEKAGALRTAVVAFLAALALKSLARLDNTALPDTAVLLFGLAFLLIAVGARVALLHLLLVVLRHGRPRSAVLIYGAGDTGLQLAAALRRHDTIVPVAFLDDSSALHGMTLAGLRVFSPASALRLAKARGAKRVILAMPALSAPRQTRIARTLQAEGFEVQTVPSFAQLIGQEALVDRLIPVLPGCFLNRAPLEPADPETCQSYAGRSLLVTGAGGSIGSELCRQLLSCRPARLVLFDLSEAALYTIDKDLRPMAGTTQIEAVLGSITDSQLVRSVLARHKVQVVFHSAAYKHVPLVEANPIAGIENNVLGTRTLAEAAAEALVDRFILISTDKAVRPGNVMGATKRLAEMAVQDLGARNPTTRFSIVRFGNVLGSSGSVVPLFREQIARGGPVTLTHDDVTRYFMTIAEAAHLLLAAGTFGGAQGAGVDVFVLDMGRPVRIRDLAVQIIEAAGYSPRDAANPDGDVEIRTIGLRPGEKLHEELFIGWTLLPTIHPKILRAQERALSEFEMAQALRLLRAAVGADDPEAARRLVFRWVEPAHLTLAAAGA